MEGVTPDERADWLNHPCTEALSVFFEIIRMKSFEQFESGITGADLIRVQSQARLASLLMKWIAEDVAKAREEEPNDG